MPTVLKAVVTFLRSDDGGRVNAPASGYRPPIWFGDVDAGGGHQLWDFEFEFTGPHASRAVPFGTEVPALMHAVSASSDDIVARAGAAFEVREGARVVGRGRVVEVVPD
jgi:translation elongation factor EF-Tu-like GTPase